MLGCFHVLTTMNNAAMNICVHVYMFSFLVSIYSRTGIAGSYGNSQGNCQTVFKMAAPFYIPTSDV